jgi:hypothetical protein
MKTSYLLFLSQRQLSNQAQDKGRVDEGLTSVLIIFLPDSWLKDNRVEGIDKDTHYQEQELYIHVAIHTYSFYYK